MPNNYTLNVGGAFETQPNYDDATAGLGSGSFNSDNTLTQAWYDANGETRGTIGHEIV